MARRHPCSRIKVRVHLLRWKDRIEARIWQPASLELGQVHGGIEERLEHFYSGGTHLKNSSIHIAAL